jgi:hypothetical protein
VEAHNAKPLRVWAYFCSRCGRGQLIRLKGNPRLEPIAINGDPELRLLVALKCCSAQWFGCRSFRSERSAQKFLTKAQVDYQKFQGTQRRRLRLEQRRLAKQLEKVQKQLEAQ